MSGVQIPPGPFFWFPLNKQNLYKLIFGLFYYSQVVKVIDSICKYIKPPTNSLDNMHILQPKHSKLNEKDTQELLIKLNISKAQLPKILSTDPVLPEGCIIGDVIKIERKDKDQTNLYFRVVV